MKIISIDIDEARHEFRARLETAGVIPHPSWANGYGTTERAAVTALFDSLEEHHRIPSSRPPRPPGKPATLLKKGIG